MSIPKILHYCFGLTEDYGGKPWSLVHHLCLLSAVQRIRPDEVLFYYEYEPQGHWWNYSRDLVTPVKVVAPREVYGRPLDHPAHRADVLRLEALIEKGGIYLDADVFVHQSFDELLNHQAVLGEEGPNGYFGVANAVMLASPQAPFLKRWLEQYSWFRSKGRDRFWSEHSVQVPLVLSKVFPDEVTVLGHRAFYWPLWLDDHLQRMFVSSEPIDLRQSYASHLWETLAWSFLKDISVARLREDESNFGSWVRPFLEGLDDPEPENSAQNAPGASEERRKAFQRIYVKGAWGRDPERPYFSGVGSRGAAAEVYVEHIVKAVQQQARLLGRPPVIVDIGCGDFVIGRELLNQLPEAQYVGCDIVPEVIEYNARFANDRVRFELLDAVTDPLPQGDVCLIRQVLQHLPNSDITAVLRKLDYAAVYVTEGQPATREGPVNPDKRVGADVRFDWKSGRGRGVELDQPPFGLRIDELCRAAVPPNEIVITHRVWPGAS